MTVKQFTIEIDGKAVEVNENMTVLDAAGAAGIEIPALCFSRQHGACNTCMVCAVRDLDRDIIPSCSTKIHSGMRVDASGPEVVEFRKNALEFLLADIGAAHGGDGRGRSAGKDVGNAPHHKAQGQAAHQQRGHPGLGQCVHPLNHDGNSVT